MRSKANTCTHSQADFPVDRRNTSHSIFCVVRPGKIALLRRAGARRLDLCWDEDDEALHVPVQYGTLEIILLRPRPFGNRPWSLHLNTPARRDLLVDIPDDASNCPLSAFWSQSQTMSPMATFHSAVCHLLRMNRFGPAS